MTIGKPISVAILAASAADLATPSFGTGMPQASHTSLPSGAVRLVRLSALTEESIWRTASLEFDIGFLLDVYFLDRRHRLRVSDPCLPARFQSIVPVIANARIRVCGGMPPAAGSPAGYGIWYARSRVVKARRGAEVLKTWGT